MNTNPPSFSNCPTSQPIYRPDEEVKTFNGLAWSLSNGIIVQSSLPDVGDPSTWFTSI